VRIEPWTLVNGDLNQRFMHAVSRITDCQKPLMQTLFYLKIKQRDEIGGVLKMKNCRRLGATRWSDPSGKLTCHLDPPLVSGAGTAPPRWGGESWYNVEFLHAPIPRISEGQLNFYRKIKIVKTFLLHDISNTRTKL